MLACAKVKAAIPPRRIFGVAFLTIAVLQVILGLTFLKGHFSQWGTLLYWGACLLSTLGALLCALLDALRNLAESREERRELLADTLREVDEKRSRHSQREDPSRAKSN